MNDDNLPVQTQPTVSNKVIVQIFADKRERNTY